MAADHYLIPDHDPVDERDYKALYAQVIAIILSTGKTSVSVPHDMRMPSSLHAGGMVIEKEVGHHSTTYRVVPWP